MLNFIIGCIVGGCVGFTIMALLQTAKFSDVIDSLHNIQQSQVYKCKINPIQSCSNMCCKFCLGATDCIYACQGDPSECGISIGKR